MGNVVVVFEQDAEGEMEFLLNEKSLDGQFMNLDDFFETLPEMSRNLKILRQRGMTLWKHSTLYTRKVTADMTLHDFSIRKGNVNPLIKDKLTLWKRELSKLTNDPPFWDSEETESADSIAEAARRNANLLSFPHTEYQDIQLEVVWKGKIKQIESVVTTKFLAELLKQKQNIDTDTYLKMRFATGRIHMDYLDNEIASVDDLEKSELEEAVIALERFEKASWEEIQRDRFFCYKSYKASRRNNPFADAICGEKQIDKFRCGQHSQVRCFGYREGEDFYVLAFERDHSLSDEG